MGGKEAEKFVGVALVVDGGRLMSGVVLSLTLLG